MGTAYIHPHLTEAEGSEIGCRARPRRAFPIGKGCEIWTGWRDSDSATSTAHGPALSSRAETVGRGKSGPGRQRVWVSARDGA